MLQKSFPSHCPLTDTPPLETSQIICNTVLRKQAKASEDALRRFLQLWKRHVRRPIWGKRVQQMGGKVEESLLVPILGGVHIKFWKVNKMRRPKTVTLCPLVQCCVEYSEEHSNSTGCFQCSDSIPHLQTSGWHAIDKKYGFSRRLMRMSCWACGSVMWSA